MLRINLALVAVLLCGGLVLNGQTAQAPAKTARRQASAGTSAPASKPTQSVIHGTAVDKNGTPLPDATVRLRDLLTNDIEQISVANQLGEFSFTARPDIPYVVEIADKSGRIIAVGNVITVQVGEVGGTVVALPAGLPTTAGMFGDTAAAVISAAAGMGVTVIDTAILPVLSATR